jgi:hypothetical protein
MEVVWLELWNRWYVPMHQTNAEAISSNHHDIDNVCQTYFCPDSLPMINKEYALKKCTKWRKKLCLS